MSDQNLKPRGGLWARPAIRWISQALSLAVTALIVILDVSNNGVPSIWRVTATILCCLLIAVVIGNALVVRRLQHRGDWTPPETSILPEPRPDQAYLQTVADWWRHRTSR